MSPTERTVLTDRAHGSHRPGARSSPIGRTPLTRPGAPCFRPNARNPSASVGPRPSTEYGDSAHRNAAIRPSTSPLTNPSPQLARFLALPAGTVPFSKVPSDLGLLHALLEPAVDVVGRFHRVQHDFGMQAGPDNNRAGHTPQP